MQEPFGKILLDFEISILANVYSPLFMTAETAYAKVPGLIHEACLC